MQVVSLTLVFIKGPWGQVTTTNGNNKAVWHTDDQVGQVDMRVDIARMDFYRLLILSRSEEDFYIEEVFNRFLSVAQTAINFAVYDEGGLLFHLVNDVKYQNHFSEALGGLGFHSEELMPLFPQLFGGKYRILVFQLNTKGFDARTWYSPIVVDENKELLLRSEDHLKTHEQYLQRCAWRFFVAKWDGFQTGLTEKAANAVGNSIESLSANFRLSPRNKGKHRANHPPKWPPTRHQTKELLDTDTPPEIAGPRHKKWHNKVRRLFERAMNDASSGLEVQHLMMQPYSVPVEKKKKPLSNMILAYRSFTRNSIRNGWHEQSNGYPYDTQFLVRDQDSGDNLPIVSFFRDMEDKAKSDEEKRKYAAGLDRGGRPRRLYRDVFAQVSEKIILSRYGTNSYVEAELKYIAELMDDRFWHYLAEKGSRWCIEVLQSPVGDNARSFVDPVYYTGLIHFNSIFELGGLDRVGKALKKAWSSEEREQFINSNEPDLLRIVMLYYLFCEMADWGGDVESFDPGRLEAILVPIKMRGSVWAVTLHAAYKPDDHIQSHGAGTKFSFQDVPRWMSIYHICSTLKQKNQDLFDKVLWGNTQQRITRLLEKSFGELDNILQHRNAVYAFNERVEREQRYLPYALPQLSPDGANFVEDHVDIKGSSGRSHQMMWGINDNSYFAAPQPWAREGTRTFHTAIEVGTNRGFVALIRKTNGK